MPQNVNELVGIDPQNLDLIVAAGPSSCPAHSFRPREFLTVDAGFSSVQICESGAFGCADCCIDWPESPFWASSGLSEPSSLSH